MEDEFKTDEILVQIDKSLSAPNKSFEADFFFVEGITEIKDLSPTPNDYTLNSYRNIFVLKFNNSSKQTIIDNIKTIEKIPGIRIVEPSWILEWASETDISINSDPYYDDFNYPYQITQIDELWDYTTGSSEIIVGVIDSGVASHQDLIDNLEEGFDFYNNNDLELE